MRFWILFSLLFLPGLVFGQPTPPVLVGSDTYLVSDPSVDETVDSCQLDGLALPCVLNVSRAIYVSLASLPPEQYTVKAKFCAGASCSAWSESYTFRVKGIELGSVRARDAARQTVYFTVRDQDGTAYRWSAGTPILTGEPLEDYLKDHRREYLCGVYRKIYREAVVEDKPQKDCYGDWRDWIDAGHKNVTTTTTGLTKPAWKDQWRTANTVLIEKTKAQATNRIEVDVDDPADNGTEVTTGYQLDDNGDGTINEVKTRIKRKIKAGKLQLKEGCQFKQADGKFYCYDRPSAEAAEAAANAPGGWTAPVTNTVETVIPAKPFKATW